MIIVIPKAYDSMVQQPGQPLERNSVEEGLLTGSINGKLNRREFYGKEEMERRDAVRKQRKHLVAGYVGFS